MDKDGLTGLLLRGQYEEDFKNMKQGDFCVVYFDINNLKKTNDSLGHRFGDKLITAAAESLKSQFRGENIYRTGGDEFIVLANGIGPQVIEQRLANIKKKMDDYTESDPDGLIYQIAAGYCVGDGIMTKQEIEEKAESLMYINKKELKGEIKTETKTERKVISEEAIEKARQSLSRPAPREDVKPVLKPKKREEFKPIPLVDHFEKELPAESLISCAVIIVVFIGLTVFLKFFA